MRGRLLILTLLCLAPFSLLRADPAIASAQQALKEQGFYYGEITGRKDADTTAAIRRYQIRNGLKITGELDAETQRLLGSGLGPARRTTPSMTQSDETSDLRDSAPSEDAGRTAPAAPNQTYSPRPPEIPPAYGPGPHGLPPEVSGIFDGTPYEVAPPALQQRVVTGAQLLLARRGYYHSDIDGVYGPGTEFALRAFQSRMGLPVSGRLDMQTLAALGLLPGQHTGGHSRPAAPAYPKPVYRGQWIPD
jgi:peptidoglycan hydrolase-like protein with peptidoglycan-binding domain